MQEIEPLDRSRGLSLLEALTSPEGWPKQTEDYTGHMREYESRVALHEQASCKRFDDDMKIETLVRNAPERVDGNTAYSTIRGLLEAYKIEDCEEAMDNAYHEHGDGGAGRGPAPIEVSVVKGKAKGKKGSSNTKGYPQQQWQQNAGSGRGCRICGNEDLLGPESVRKTRRWRARRAASPTEASQGRTIPCSSRAHARTAARGGTRRRIIGSR